MISSACLWACGPLGSNTVKRSHAPSNSELKPIPASNVPFLFTFINGLLSNEVNSSSWTGLSAIHISLIFPINFETESSEYNQRRNSGNERNENDCNKSVSV